MATAVWTVRTNRTARGAAAPRDSIGTACIIIDEAVGGGAAPIQKETPMPRLATERAWYTPLLIVGAVLLLLAVYAVLLWVVTGRGRG